MTQERRWRTAYASAIGTSHQKTGTPCQDAGDCRVLEAADGSEVLLAAVSDGAGTASRSDVGSQFVVAHFLEFYSRLVHDEPGDSMFERSHVDRWFSEVRERLRIRSDEDGGQLQDYACTFLGAIVGTSMARYIQIGDGGIVVSTGIPGQYACVIAPQHGEYANSTFFVTQDGAEQILKSEPEAAVKEIALFSDGIERLVLDMKTGAAHGPAFQPMFEWLAGTEPDRSGGPSRGLLAYLESEHINRRTDDDKTLVLATRAVPPLPRPETEP